jgi:hypothetical protein
MRFAELAFLLLLLLYHAFLLAPRHRRPFAANYLVFLAGMALAWSLAMEGLRWQTLPPLVLLLVDLALLFPTFVTLRGRLPRPGFWSGLAGVTRTVVASAAFLLAVAFVVLAVAFPLPKVELTGGLAPSYRVVRFPPAGEVPGLELRLWYPASGDSRPEPRADSKPETWRRTHIDGGPAVFWQSYLEHLPTSLVRGGKLASPGTRYPIVFVAVPRNQNPDDFAYVFEDLASRGFVVAAGLPLPSALPPQEPFSWGSAVEDLAEPFHNPSLWLEPDLTLGRSEGPADYRWVAQTQAAVRQLASEPGDALFSGIDWGRQGLWVWGYGTPLAPADQAALGLRCVLHAGGRPPAGHVPAGPELWIFGGAGAKPVANQWFLTLPRLNRADLSDAAYLKPALVFYGLKSQADAGLHGALRQYQAAFFQYAFWSSSGAAFSQTVPEIQGLVLSGN